MGNDFIKKAAPGYRKGWNRESAILVTGDLFTNQPGAPIWVAKLSPLNGNIFAEGEYYSLRSSGMAVVAYAENRPIGRDDNPPSGLIESIASAGGIGLGVVRKIHRLSGRADVDVHGVPSGNGKNCTLRLSFQ